MPAQAAFDDARLDANLAAILQGMSHKARGGWVSAVMAGLYRLYASRRAAATVTLALILAIGAGTMLIHGRARYHGSDAAGVGSMRPPAAQPARSGPGSRAESRLSSPTLSEALSLSEDRPAARARPVPVAAAPAGDIVATARPRGHRTPLIVRSDADGGLTSATRAAPPLPAAPSLAPGDVAALAPETHASDIRAAAGTIASPDRQVRRDTIDAMRAFRRQ